MLLIIKEWCLGVYPTKTREKYALMLVEQLTIGANFERSVKVKISRKLLHKIIIIKTKYISLSF